MTYDEMRKALEDREMQVDYYEGLLLDISGLYYLSSNDELKAVYREAKTRVIVQYYFVPGGDSDDAENAELMSRIDAYGSGMSFYLPVFRDMPVYNKINAAFKKDYDWSKASGFDQDRK